MSIYLLLKMFSSILPSDFYKRLIILHEVSLKIHIKFADSGKGQSQELLLPIQMDLLAASFTSLCLRL